MADRLPVRDALVSFLPQAPLRAALFMTYSFDGRWFEEAILPDLCERPIQTMLVIRDRNAMTSEARSVRYRKANACLSSVFHPKLSLLVTEDSARAVISSANLTRGGYERQRELGRVFDLTPSKSSDLNVFRNLVDYLKLGASKEVIGESLRDLNEIAEALQDVIEKCSAADDTGAHSVFHNYDKSIWKQVLERLPHRVLKRAVIVSPFFEPDRKHPEDPGTVSDDGSVFSSLLDGDFEFDPPKGESPVRVFFRQSEGRTELPLTKLTNLAKKVTFLAQDEREDRLHAKLLIFEGVGGLGREPFLFALHGSPNFTAAGLLKRPPYGNSELAVLTKLPAKSRSLEQCLSVLGLDKGFTEVEDISALVSEINDEPPMPPTQAVGDVTYRVAEGVVAVFLMQPTPIGASVRVLLQRDGAWLVIGQAVASGVSEVLVPVIGLSEIDPKTQLLELRATTLRIEVVDIDGSVITADVPVNVDVPGEFCGVTLVGTSLLTLDERIARSGVGMPLTYREQQEWLEGRASQEAELRAVTVTTHQADLDRFYRNVHQGLRGRVARMRANPGSEFAARRCLDELFRWACEAASSDWKVLSRECRMFLIERLLSCARTVLDSLSTGVKARISLIADELRFSERLQTVRDWLADIKEIGLVSYAGRTGLRASQMLELFKNGYAE